MVAAPSTLPPAHSSGASRTKPVRAETPMAFVRSIVAAYQARGLSPQAALERAQITPRLLENPTHCITALQMEWLSEHAMRELDDEALGGFERRLPWGSYGMLARASLTAPTLGLALARWCRHHGLLTERIALDVAVHGGCATLTLTERSPLPDALREFTVVSVLRNALGLACWLIDSRIPLLGTTLAFAAPPHQARYAVLFDGPTAFGATHHSLRFDAGYLALPVRRDEAALQRMLQRALLLTVRPYRRDRLLVDKVHQALAHDAALQRNAQALAEHLALSVRTLHRQLKEEGTTLQALKDRVRLDAATQLLQRTRRPLKQVAQAAGFASEKSFIRAFREWTGMTPGEWRERSGVG